jgi:hypothetical protein
MLVHAEEALDKWRSCTSLRHYVTRGMIHVLAYLSPTPLHFHFPDQSISLTVSLPVLIIASIEGICDVWLLLSPASQLLGPQPAPGETSPQGVLVVAKHRLQMAAINLLGQYGPI